MADSAAARGMKQKEYKIDRTVTEDAERIALVRHELARNEELMADRVVAMIGAYGPVTEPTLDRLMCADEEFTRLSSENEVLEALLQLHMMDKVDLLVSETGELLWFRKNN